MFIIVFHVTADNEPHNRIHICTYTRRPLHPHVLKRTNSLLGLVGLGLLQEVGAHTEGPNGGSLHQHSCSHPSLGLESILRPFPKGSETSKEDYGSQSSATRNIGVLLHLAFKFLDPRFIIWYSVPCWWPVLYVFTRLSKRGDGVMVVILC